MPIDKFKYKILEEREDYRVELNYYPTRNTPYQYIKSTSKRIKDDWVGASEPISFYEYEQCKSKEIEGQIAL